MQTEAEAKGKVTIEAVIIRKDGTREDLGVIASSKNKTVDTSKDCLSRMKGLVK
jgi:hypothetical protein